MRIKAKPFSLRRSIGIAVVVAAAFSLLSLFFLFLQARNAYDRLAGEVVAVADGGVSIQNARGTITFLTFPPEAELHGVLSADLLIAGQRVMTRGSFATDGSFEVDRLRVLRDFELR